MILLHVYFLDTFSFPLFFLKEMAVGELGLKCLKREGLTVPLFPL